MGVHFIGHLCVVWCSNDVDSELLFNFAPQDIQASFIPLGERLSLRLLGYNLSQLLATAMERQSGGVLALGEKEAKEARAFIEAVTKRTIALSSLSTTTTTQQHTTTTTLTKVRVAEVVRPHFMPGLVALYHSHLLLSGFPALGQQLQDCLYETHMWHHSLQ